MGNTKNIIYMKTFIATAVLALTANAAKEVLVDYVDV